MSHVNRIYLLGQLKENPYDPLCNISMCVRQRVAFSSLVMTSCSYLLMIYFYWWKLIEQLSQQFNKHEINRNKQGSMPNTCNDTFMHRQLKL